MPVHDEVAARFHLLDGIPSLEAAMADPDMDRRMREFMAPPLDAAPEVPTRDVAVAGPHGPIPVRVYGPAAPAEPRPALLWMHGGAFMMGDLDMGEADRTAREVCARARAVVVSVDYRLAVGGVHHPVPLDDVVAAARWLRDHAQELGVDSARITVGGASAGGNLATAAVLRLRDEEGWLPHALVPVYPVMHERLPDLSPELRDRLAEIPETLVFTPEATAGINMNYLGGPLDLADGRSFPALADVTGLCRTVLVNAEYDDLRASGEAFTQQLEDAGVEVHQHLAPGMLHGFLNLSARLEPVDDVLQLVSDTVGSA